MLRLIFIFALFGCDHDQGAASGALVHGCPVIDTLNATADPGLIVAGAPTDAAVLAWECAEPNVDCVSTPTGRDDRGWWRVACSGDDARPVLVVRWWVNL